MKVLVVDDELVSRKTLQKLMESIGECQAVASGEDALKAVGLDSGSTEPGRTSAGSISRAKLREIAEMKAEDLNAGSPEAAMKIIAGTARSMGLDVV